jgi:hypothetical protein
VVVVVAVGVAVAPISKVLGIVVLVVMLVVVVDSGPDN